MESDADLIQLAERALADAEAALRQDPTEANRRRVMDAWSFVQRARGGEHPLDPRPGRAF